MAGLGGLGGQLVGPKAKLVLGLAGTCRKICIIISVKINYSASLEMKTEELKKILSNS